MMATTDCGEKSKPVTGKKVSKPLMEKKRRARINKCLEQLKCLLESYYSTSIRKRKLEKADILELTVNHLRNLQKIQSCTVAPSDRPEYRSGFRRCLADVGQYLLMSDHLNASDRWMLSRLSADRWRSRGREEEFSTTDSGPGPAGTQDEARGPPEEPEPDRSKAAETDDARRTSGRKQAQNTQANSCSLGKFHGVWRPW